MKQFTTIEKLDTGRIILTFGERMSLSENLQEVFFAPEAMSI